jgi:hypothetical protein
MAKKTTQDLFNKVEDLAQQVKHDLRRKGVIVPVKNKDGSINLDKYRVVKTDDFFYVLDQRNESLVGPVNLAQTAILIANDLALGKFIDSDIVKQDTWFGYKSFDEESYTRSARINLKKHNIEQAEIFLTRAELAKQQKNYWKRTITDRFNKLQRVR